MHKFDDPPSVANCLRYYSSNKRQRQSTTHVSSDSDTCSSKTERETKTETETDKLTTEESELEDVFN